MHDTNKNKKESVFVDLFKLSLTLFVILIVCLISFPSPVFSYDANHIFDEKITFQIVQNTTLCKDCVMLITNLTKLSSIINEMRDNISFQENFSDDYYDACNNSLLINSQGIVENRLRFDFTIYPRDVENYEIRYWISDYFGNIVRTPFVTRNTNLKQFTPTTNELFQLYTIHSELSIDGCNSTITAEKNVFYVNENFAMPEDEDDEIDYDFSVVAIEHVYQENNLKYDSSVEIRIKFVNRGNRDSISIYVIDKNNKIISDILGFDAFRNSNAVITQKLMIDSQCSNDENVTIVMTGFGLSDMRQVLLRCSNPVVGGSIDIDSNVTLSPTNLIESNNNDAEVQGNIISNLIFNDSQNLLDFSVLYSGRSHRALNNLPKIIFISLIFVSVVFIKYKL